MSFDAHVLSWKWHHYGLFQFCMNQTTRGSSSLNSGDLSIQYRPNKVTFQILRFIYTYILCSLYLNAHILNIKTNKQNTNSRSIHN